MNIQYIERELGASCIRTFLRDEIKKGKEDAEKKLSALIEPFLKSIENPDLQNEVKLIKITSELVFFNKIIFNNSISNFSFFTNNYKNISAYNLNNTVTEQINFDDLVDYILKFYDFNRTQDFFLINKFRKISSESENYYLVKLLEIELVNLLTRLNELNLNHPFKWRKDNIEFGIVDVLHTLYKEKLDIISDSEEKIRRNNRKFKDEIIDLKDEIEQINKEKYYLNDELIFQKSYNQKYIESYSTIIAETYFGDNLPFLLQLYNFLKTHRLMSKYGWSYFYLCMITNNTDKIDLESKKESKFIGRVFYNLIDFLTPKYRENHRSLFTNKFTLNGKTLNENFFVNHMRAKYDETLHPNFQDVDDFFSDLRKIYLKSK